MAIDYKEVLIDLKRRRAEIQRHHEREIGKLDQAIAAIEEMTPKQPTLAFSAGRTDSESESGSLPYSEHRTIREAALACLRHHGQPMKTKELARELLDGGFKSESQNFATTVYGSLARYKSEFSVVDGVWSLAEWARVASRKPTGST